MIPEVQAEIVAALSLPAFYGARGESVARIDTHISCVFLAGDRAYKLKRAVRLPFLDFTTLAARHQACATEVAVNRLNAPEIYLGAVPITREESGALCLNGQGQPVDWLVAMRRFDQDALLDRMAEKGSLTDEMAEPLADAVRAFHAGAERRDDRGGVKGLAWVIDTNARTFADLQEDAPDPQDCARLEILQREALARHGPLLERRRENGCVRRCHGDLHLGNLCLWQNRPTPFDAIEFSEDLACIDRLYDLAFLLMDLEHRGLYALAHKIFCRYVTMEREEEGLAAFPLFLSLRAAIRSHVAAATARARDRAADKVQKRAEARAYLDQALAYLAPPKPVLLAVGGLSGSGKSRLAREAAPLIGPAPGALLLRSDVLRKQLAGVDPLTRLSEKDYSAEMTERTYADLFARAAQALAAGHSVVADAVFARPEQRQMVESLAQNAGLPFVGVWLEARPEIMAERIERRRNNASDATVEVLKKQLDYDLGAISWMRIDSSGARDATRTHALNALAGLFPLRKGVK